MVVKAFDTVTGLPVVTVPATDWSWSREVSTSGRFEAKIKWSQEATEAQLREKTPVWATTLADVRPDGSVAATGLMYHRMWDGSTLTLQCVGWEDILDKLPVINHLLDAVNVDGRVLDPDAEGVVIPAAWQQTFKGASIRDVLIQLVASGLLWQSLPIDLPAHQSGSAATRTYWSTDLATVRDRVNDIAKLADGVEWRIDPYMNGRQLRHRLVVGNPEAKAPQSHIINATAPDVVVSEISVDEDASEMRTDVWGKGGVQGDQILIARKRETSLESAGAPRLFGQLTGHDTVSELSTLQQHVREASVVGSFSQEVWSFTVDRTQFDVMPGDWVDLKWGRKDGYLPPGWYGLKILATSGGPNDQVKLQGRLRYA